MFDSNQVLQMAREPGSIERLTKDELEKFLQTPPVAMNDGLRDLRRQAFDRARSALDELAKKEARKRVEQQHDEILAVTAAAAQRGQAHDLWAWIKLADWQERCGMAFTFSLVFAVGFLCAETRFFRTIMKAIVDVIP